MADGQLLQPGDPAPDFALASPSGETVRLSDFRGQSEVVVFFYPKDGRVHIDSLAPKERYDLSAAREA